MTSNKIIEELNTLLKGIYMGIHSFEHYIQKVDNEELKKHFQSMQQEIKQNALKISERIQNLGGVPADDEGFTGSITSFMHNIMLPDDRRKIIENALEGLDKYGVRYSEELVKGDLDPESRKVAEEVINTSRRQVDQLNHLLH